jgi:nucleotide-binding universal stress UspA family protein
MPNREVIVAGVDGSEGGRRALRWAVDEAGRTGATVLAVTAWTWDGIDSKPFAAPSPGDERARAEAISVGEVDAVSADAEVPVTINRDVVRGEAAAALVNAARAARMLVLGRRGRSLSHHVVLGTVSEACLRKAYTAVVVVPVPPPAQAPAEPSRATDARPRSV